MRRLDPEEYHSLLVLLLRYNEAMTDESIIKQVEGMYRVLRLSRFRTTPGVSFDVLVPRLVPQVDAIDRVIHETGAISPGSVGEIMQPWYMHPNQADHLLVLDGTRYVDLYSPILGRVVSFEIESDRVTWEGELICDTACMLVWSRGVFHRIRSDAATGSRSVNLATHYPGFDLDTNFNVYNLDVETGEYWVIRAGFQDQDELPE